jgi:hypothetical protein
VDENFKKVGRKPQFSDLEVIGLNIVAEYLSIDSENFLFKKINESFKSDFPNLVDRSQFNRRKKYLFNYIDKTEVVWLINLLNLKSIISWIPCL